MSVATIKLSLLMLVFIPLLISNLRTGMVKNGMLGTMFAIGVLVAFFGPAFGAQPLKLFALLGWGLTAGLLLGIAAYGAVSGGVAHCSFALVPVRRVSARRYNRNVIGSGGCTLDGQECFDRAANDAGGVGGLAFAHPWLRTFIA